jgi:hypothetical protein
MSSEYDDLRRRIEVLESRETAVYQPEVFTDAVKWSVNSTKGVADNGLINLASSFGVPAKVKSVRVRVDVSSSIVTFTSLGPTAGSTRLAFYTDPGGHDEWMIHYGEVQCNADGNIYVTFTGTIYFILYITGYYT